jgi:hypothetical protein
MIFGESHLQQSATRLALPVFPASALTTSRSAEREKKTCGKSSDQFAENLPHCDSKPYYAEQYNPIQSTEIISIDLVI